MTIIPFPREQHGAVKTDQPIEKLDLPVAPQANSRIRFAGSQKQDEPLLPVEALKWLSNQIKTGRVVKAVNLCGPGDPLACPEPVLETAAHIQNAYSGVDVHITTLGLGAKEYASLFAEKGVSQAILLVDAVDTEVAKQLYAWIRPDRKTVPLSRAVELLVQEQADAVEAFTKAGIPVSISTTIYPGINDRHVARIAGKMASLGAQSMTLIPFEHDGSECEDCVVPTSAEKETMQASLKLAARHIQVSVSSKRKANILYKGNQSLVGSPSLKPIGERPNVAVVSSNGMDVDLHLGQARQILIYGPRGDGLACLLGTRPAPEKGSGNSRWEQLADILDDCFVLLAAGAGDNPRRILGQQGIKVIITNENIDGTVDVLYGGGKKNKCRK
jgi:nitrogen fixation protein NifB